MKKRTVIKTKKHEVWVIRPSNAEPDVQDEEDTHTDDVVSPESADLDERSLLEEDN